MKASEEKKSIKIDMEWVIFCMIDQTPGGILLFIPNFYYRYESESH
jgi:hypothetical protein